MAASPSPLTEDSSSSLNYNGVLAFLCACVFFFQACGRSLVPLVASSPGPFTRALHASTWKKGLVSSVCAHAAKFHFHGILYSSVYFLYISGVYYVMNIGWSNLWSL